MSTLALCFKWSKRISLASSSLVHCPLSTGDSSEGQPPMEELGDAKGLLGGWGAEGDIVQGEVIQ